MGSWPVLGRYLLGRRLYDLGPGGVDLKPSADDLCQADDGGHHHTQNPKLRPGIAASFLLLLLSPGNFPPVALVAVFGVLLPLPVPILSVRLLSLDLPVLEFLCHEHLS